jgi:HD superfamily phosphodiesterase
MSDLNPYEEGLALELKAAQERIEALIAEVERVTAINAKHCNAVNTLLIDGARLEERAKKAEAERDALTAKLAQAVEAFDMLVRDCEADYPPSHGAIKHFARATLAEIKGGKDAESNL